MPFSELGSSPACTAAVPWWYSPGYCVQIHMLTHPTAPKNQDELLALHISVVSNRRKTNSGFRFIIEDFCNFYFEMFSPFHCWHPGALLHWSPLCQKKHWFCIWNSISIWLRLQKAEKTFLLSHLCPPAEIFYPARLSGSATSRHLRFYVISFTKIFSDPPWVCLLHPHAPSAQQGHSITLSALKLWGARLGKGSCTSLTAFPTSFSVHLKSPNCNRAEHNGKSVSTCLI